MLSHHHLTNTQLFGSEREKIAASKKPNLEMLQTAWRNVGNATSPAESQSCLIVHTVDLGGKPFLGCLDTRFQTRPGSKKPLNMRRDYESDALSRNVKYCGGEACKMAASRRHLQPVACPAYQLGNPISSLWPNALLVLFFKIVPVRSRQEASKQADFGVYAGAGAGSVSVSNTMGK